MEYVVVLFILNNIYVSSERSSNHVKSGPFKACSAETAYRIKLCPLRYLFRMTRTTTYPKISQIRRKTFSHKISAGSSLFKGKVTTHPLYLGCILIFQRFRRISVRINLRDFTMHICKRHRQYPALEKYLFYPAHDYAHIYVFTLAVVRIISRYSSRLYK